MALKEIDRMPNPNSQEQDHFIQVRTEVELTNYGRGM